MTINGILYLLALLTLHLDLDLCLRWPKNSHYHPEPGILNKLTVFFSAMFTQPGGLLKNKIPSVIVAI